MLSKQQRRLRRENFDGGIYVPFSEKTCDNKKIKITYYGTIQDLYDKECSCQYDYGYEEYED